MKAAQFEADLAAHKRRERMMELKARQERGLQEQVWMDVMEWNGRQLASEKAAKEEAMRLFMEQRAMKLAEDQEFTEKRKHAEQKMQYEIQEKLAEKAAREAEEVERRLREKEDEARLLAAEVELMKEDAAAANEQALNKTRSSASTNTKSPRGFGFGGLFSGRKAKKGVDV